MGNCIRTNSCIVPERTYTTKTKMCDASTNTESFPNKLEKRIVRQQANGRSLSEISILKQLNIGSEGVEIEEPQLLKSLKQRHFEKTSNLSFVGRPSPRETTKVIVTKDETGKTIINEYILSKRLGRGTYGKVNLCIHEKTNELRAIKIINKSILKRARQRFSKKSNQDPIDILKTEVAILKKLDHPNVVKLYEVIDDEKSGKLYLGIYQCQILIPLVVEYVENGPVMRVLSKDKVDRQPYSEGQARKFLIDLIYGLEYLHSSKVIHRDIKPENLLVDKSGTLKLTDFGVSAMFEGQDDTLYSSAGTPAFLAPECCTSSKFQGKPADIWAVGVTLYVLLYGKLPFYGEGYLGIYNSILHDEPKFSDANMLLKDLFKRLLEKDPNKRITLDQLKVHPWVTDRQSIVLINPKIENGKQLKRSLTKLEILTSITTKVEYKTVNKFILTVKMKKKFGKHLENVRFKISSRKKDEANKQNNDEEESEPNALNNQQQSNMDEDTPHETINIPNPNESDMALLSSNISHVSNSTNSSAKSLIGNIDNKDFQRSSSVCESPTLTSKYSSIFIKVTSDGEESDSDEESIIQIPGSLETRTLEAD